MLVTKNEDFKIKKEVDIYIYTDEIKEDYKYTNSKVVL